MQARCSRKSAISIIAERTLHLFIKARVASHDAHRKLAFSTLAHDTLGIIPLAAGVVTTLRTSAKNSVQELVDYTTYVCSVIVLTKLITGNGHTSVVVALCVCFVLCTEMSTSNIGHLTVYVYSIV